MLIYLLTAEGLMLKASNSLYNQGLQWVKMKVCFAISAQANRSTPSSRIMATALTSWSSELAGIWSVPVCFEVRCGEDAGLMPVDTSVFTTFYFGVLTNKEAVLSRRERPHFQFLFRSSWGLSRKDLGVYNYSMRLGRWSHKPYDRDDPAKRVRQALFTTTNQFQRLAGLSWTWDLPPSIPPPSILLDRPLCAEVTGLGFQKLEFCDVRPA